MKNIKYLIGTCALLIVVSCQKLDREIDTSLSRDLVDTVYANKSNEINNLYRDVPNGLSYIDNAMMASATDEAEHTPLNGQIQDFNNGNWSSVNLPDNVWNMYYRQIRWANQAIVSLDRVSLLRFKNDPSATGQQLYRDALAEVRRWKFEARFMRAYYYFELVKRYGGVPLLTEALTLDTDFSQVKRESLENCINFIVKECEIIEPELPPYGPLANYPDERKARRATKYAVMALKSRVLLYAASELWNSPNKWAAGYPHPELISVGTSSTRSQRWQAAADAAKRLIDTCAKYGVGLYNGGANNSYRNLFQANNHTLPEVFFVKNTTGATNQFERNNYPVGFAGGLGYTTPTQNLVDAYEVKVGNGASATSVDFNWNDADHVKNIYNFSASTNTSLTRDPRLNYTIVTNGRGSADAAAVGTYGSNFGYAAVNRRVQTYVSGLDGPPKTNASRTGYYLRKYIQENLDFNQGNQGVHSWVVFRLAEVYLNYAEALNEVSPGDTKITQYLNLIRARTGVAMPEISSTLSQIDMRKKIRNERSVELAFEDHRFWDLRRWMDEGSLTADIRGVEITGTSVATFIHTPKKVEGRVFKSNMYLYPITFTELSIGKALIQNPGW